MNRFTRSICSLVLLLVAAVAPAFAASPYTSLVGTLQSPLKLAFRAQFYRLLSARIANCPSARATTYYFAQAGNDSTGNGSQATPYKTLAKAQTLVADNVRLRFNRGDTWQEATGLADNGHPITIDA